MPTNIDGNTTQSGNLDWLTVVLLMLLGMLIGTVALWCYQRVITPKEKADDGSFWKNLGMAAGAVTLVPAFLRMVSSSLIKETSSSIEAKFVFVGFCVAASFTARRFLAVVPEKILNKLENAEQQAEEAQNRVMAVEEVVANKTADAKPPSPEAIKRIEEVSKTTGYDWKALLLVRAFLNLRFSKSRTTTGLAFDSGLDIPETIQYLKMMQKNGDVVSVPGDSRRGDWWALTHSGRTKFEPMRTQFAKDDVGETGIQ